MNLTRSYLDAVERVLVDAIDNQIDPLIQTIPGVEDRQLSYGRIGATTGAKIVESAEAQPEADGSNKALSMASLLKQFVGSSMADIPNIHQEFNKAVADRKKVLLCTTTGRRVRSTWGGMPRFSDGGRMSTACDNFDKTIVAGSPNLEAANENLLRQHGERSLLLCFIAQDWELGAKVLSDIWEHYSELLDKLYTHRSDSSLITTAYIAAIEEHSDHLEPSFS
ncbi:hypothetical protein BKA56DRAFT_668111 [Ilyonectria sp. MPI-CAGE-AT-0026]|nr:hypothetical protein BKA56DRAFT_668111 [Ilyonectria sp. MPI-CAGE-AT-0026]